MNTSPGLGSPSRLAAIILAGGQSQRFGRAKLGVELGGLALGLHCAAALSALQLPIRIAVCGAGAPDYAGYGFESIALEPPNAPMSRSIALGIAQARIRGAHAALIALADMPLVPAQHFAALIAAFGGQVVASQVNGTAMPPAIFGAALFDQLGALPGDMGARALLADAPAVCLSPELAFDIDREEDLPRAARLLAERAK